jgi:hypothetical protein
MDWISAIPGFFFDQLADVANAIDRHFDLTTVVLVCAALLLVLALALAKPRR